MILLLKAGDWLEIKGEVYFVREPQGVVNKYAIIPVSKGSGSPLRVGNDLVKIDKELRANYDIKYLPDLAKLGVTLPSENTPKTDIPMYLGGDMLTKGSQMLRTKERDEVAELGIPIYNPADQKDINDKQYVVSNDDLAERIVKKDSDALRASQLLAYDLSGTCIGTTVELGQSLGMLQLAKELHQVLLKDDSDGVVLDKVWDIVSDILSKKHYPHMEDIRHFETTETGQRRSFSINAYLLGTALELTNGVGFYDWEDVLKELEEIKQGEK